MTGELHKIITPNQIRAARALLDWTQGELAKKSGLSLRALNSIERGLSVPRIDNLRAIQGALENANIEFLEFDGTRRRTERMEIIKFEGKNYFEEYLLDSIRETRSEGTEMLYCIFSEKEFSGLNEAVFDDYYRHAFRYRIKERIIIPRGDTFILSPPSVYRWTKPELFSKVSYVVYGDTTAFMIPTGPHRTIIIRNPGIAEMFRRQFEANWAMAEVPWFVKRYKPLSTTEPWSVAKARAAREWIADEKP